MIDREKLIRATGNPKPGTGTAFAAGWEPAEEKEIGRDPRSMTADELRALGHPGHLLKAVRLNCLECQGGNAAEVRRCMNVWCPMWPYRMGVNPFHRIALSENQKKERRERLRAIRARQGAMS